MSDWLSIAVGLVMLIVSADLLVRGAVWIALALGVRQMVVGVTVVAFGTSAPELAACLAGALEGQAGLATGTVLGSNIANIGLIVGGVALVAPIRHPPAAARFEVRWLLAITFALAGVLLLGTVTRWAGAVLLLCLAWFTYQLVQRELASHRRTRAAGRTAHGGGTAALHVLLAVVGLCGLPFGAEWLRTGAEGVARAHGVSDQVIGIAVVAIGTSLPELAASITAAMRKHPEIALGNVLGSNLFNMCMVLGATATISPLPFTWAGEGPHVLVGIALTVALAALLRVWHGVGRFPGLLMLLGYAGYLTWTVLRG